MEKIRKQNQPKKFFCWHAENYRHKKTSKQTKTLQTFVSSYSTYAIFNKSFVQQKLYVRKTLSVMSSLLK